MDNLSGSAANYYSKGRSTKKKEVAVIESPKIDPVVFKNETSEIKEMLDQLIKKAENLYDLAHRKQLHDMLTTLGMAKRDLKNLMN